MDIPTIDNIHDARRRIRSRIHNTPVVTSRSLDEHCNASLYLKCENLQKVGAFKFRGATNAVLSLSGEEASAGVATHSSGNHAQALALAARQRGIPAYIVMPENAPAVKVKAVRGYGAEITFCEPTQQAREETLGQVVTRTGAVFIHPYNDPRIIAGQGTAALELLEEQPALDAILVPAGGGGLLSGTAIAAKGINPGIRVLGIEPAEADDAYRSFRAGKLIPLEHTETVADGLRTSLGDLTFACIQQHVDAIVTVSEKEIIAAMRFVWERLKLVIEPSSAVPVAALLHGKADMAGKKAGIILSGGNADLDHLPWHA